MNPTLAGVLLAFATFAVVYAYDGYRQAKRRSGDGDPADG